MATAYHLQILAMDRIVFEGEVTSIVAPGAAGKLGVLAHHAALIAELGAGSLMVRDTADKVTHYNLKGGLLEVGGNRAVVLVDGSVEVGSAPQALG